MASAAIIERALQMDVVLFLKDGALSYRARAGQGIPEGLRKEIAANKQAIIDYLRYLQSEGRSALKLPPILRRKRESDAPLSYGQQQLMFVDRLGAGSRQFNIQGVFRVDGSLDRECLQRAIGRVVQRHEVLRTNIVELDGEFFQFLNEPADVPCRFIDLSGQPEPERERRLAEVIRADAETGFDLERDVLLRVHVVKLAAQDHVLAFCMHHIVSDGWSLGAMIKELMLFYTAQSTGIPASISELPIQYTDYAYWQRELLEGPFRTKGVEFWKQYLQGIPEVHHLPLDHARPAEPDFAAIRLEQHLQGPLLSGLKEICSQQEVTLFMLLQTAFAVLLHRFSGETDIVIGTPMSGRVDAALEPLIGLFINTVVLRNRFDPEQTFLDHLRASRERMLSVHEYQYVPFELLVEELNPTRTAAYNPIFQIWFVLQNNERVELALPGCRIRSDRRDQVDTAKYELNLYVTEQEGGLRIAWVAREQLFKRETIAYVMDQFAALLEQLVQRPDWRIRDVPVFEASAIATALNSPDAAVDTSPVLARFRNQVLARPAATAIRCEGREISYGRLDALSDAFAAVLAKVPQSRIGLCLSHGVDFVVAIWSCIKAGKVYVPLNPEYPLERLRYIVEDAGVQTVVRNHSTEDLLIGLDPVTCIDLDSRDLPETQGAASCVDPAQAQLAYILYTSGSTGRPKGILQNHRSVAYYVSCYASLLNIGPRDRLLQVASFSHDAAVLDMFSALTTGACLQLIDIKKTAREEVLMAIADGVTLYHSSASVFKYLFSDSRERMPASLRAAVFGGEAPDAAALRLAEACLPEQCLVANLYGSTEATLVMLNGKRVSDGLESCQRLAHVVPGTSLRILDDHGQLAHVYQPGELVIESPFVAAGYLNQDVLTQQRFVPGASGARAYRSGDLACLLPDGTLRFLGRRDNQVKINGLRIEPEEIEAQLMRHPQVRACAVVPKSDAESQATFLAAFVVSDAAEDARQTLAESLRATLSLTMPAYMVPAVITFVEELLHTPSGKIDRIGMRDWAVARQQRMPAVQPRSELESELCAIWAKVLGRAPIGVEDGFFALGGNSLKSLQILASVSRKYDVELTLREFFAAPTVAGCAQLIETKRDSRTRKEALPVIVADAANRHRPFPLTSIQQAYWLGRSGSFDLGNVATQGYIEHDIAGYDHARMTQALRKLIARHDMLRAIIDEAGEQRILPDVPDYEIPLHDYSARSHEHLEQHLHELRAEMRSQVRSVHRWPIFDFRVTLLPEGVGRLHVCTDAIIMDARSRSILVRELMELILDPTLELPSLEISFRDYVLAEQRLQQTQAYLEARKYWMDRIDSLPKAPELPLAVEPSKVKKPQFVRRTHQLARADWEKLIRRATQLQVTPMCLLLTAFSDVLAYWSSRRDFTLNLTLFNRLPLHEQVEQLVGDFTTSSLLEVHAAPRTCFAERARRIQQQLLDDIDHRMFNGVDVLRELISKEKRSGAALMPVVFTGLVGFSNDADRTSAAQQLIRGRSTTVGATQTSQVYLDCQVFDADDSVAITWNCVDELFFPGVLDDMFAAYVSWLEALAETEDACERPMLRLLPERQRRLIDATNRTAVPRESVLLHELFTRNVATFGSAPAVITSQRSLTYSVLDRESSLLAARLVAHGVVRSDHVAVLMSKGWEQVVAVMAILKAGGAYLPIDVNLPQKRIDFLLAQTQTRVVLIQEHFDESQLGSNVIVEKVVPRESIDAAPAFQAPEQQPSDLAYTIFTSGSTGTPKGVMIDHAGAVNTVVDINQRFGVSARDRVFAISELNFDLSVYDIFGVLAAGAALVLPNASQTRDPRAWLDLIHEHGVTVWNSVPALAKLLFDSLRPGDTGLPLRVVMMSGDWIPLSLPPQIQAAAPAAKIYSLGGATEASIWSVYFPIETVQPDWRSVPYGVPLENQTLKILNAELQPCPLWVRGDLYIGGMGVALGYHRDEQRTQASFIADPEGEGRLYRTGDVARYMDDGNIEFLGREDNQVKINGYRIELGEIETQLNRLESVKEAIVVAVGERNDKRLVAYVVPAVEMPLAEVLEPQLRQVLPAYMVPDIYIGLREIPLTANGKVDRNHLPAPDLSGMAQAEHVPPATRIEAEIADIWRGLLNRDAIGVTDNFFALGGNSILAVRVIMSLRDRYGLGAEDFQFNEFFTAATVRAVAGVLEAALAKRQARGVQELIDNADYVESGLV